MFLIGRLWRLLLTLLLTGDLSFIPSQADFWDDIPDACFGQSAAQKS
jgi:hypothetical protein